MSKIDATVRRILAVTLAGAPLAAESIQLPVPCIAGSCGSSAPSNWVTSGAATAVQAGKTLTVNQSTTNATLNWQSFNISADGTVAFKQPGTTSVALNEIFQNDPSRILGALKANGSIYLINQNGIVFGQGAQVNVGTLVASSLNITPQALNGILQAAQASKPAFQQATDANGNPIPAGSVQVQPGATVQTSPGGQVMLFAPQVINGGTIHADGGQVILAAGDSVYLAASTDPNLRGLVVGVGNGGTVTNQVSGAISASQGNVSLAGLMVNQQGRVSATTSIRENGSIYLLAQDHVTVLGGGSGGAPVTLSSAEGGMLELGPGSQTEISLALNDPSSTVDATPQPHSQVTLSGKTVELQKGAQVIAPSGNVSVTAAATPGVIATLQPGSGRLVIDSGAGIDVSGANIGLPMESNVIPVQLRGTELANSPLQRNGPLRGQTVNIDIRQSGVLADGTQWVGTPIGDLSGYVAAVPRTVGQRSLTGGTISLSSDGAVFVDPGARLNVSGGSATYAAGYLDTTKVIGTNGLVYDISQAVPTQTYSGIISSYSITDPKWGVTRVFPTFSSSQYEPGYVQGYDAGTVTVLAPASVLDGTITATTIAGPFQRQLPGAIPAGALYRPVNQLPTGAELVVGARDTTLGPDPQNVIFQSGTVLDQLRGPGGGPFDPLTDPLPPSLTTMQLQPSLFGANGVTDLQAYAQQNISLPADVSLHLPPASVIALHGTTVDIAGKITSPSGAVSAFAAVQSGNTAAPGDSLVLKPTAAIDVSGLWVNDLPLGSTVPGEAPLAIKGGTVTLSASGGIALDLGSGSVVDVSGGAQRTAGGSLNAGPGGSISLAVAPGSTNQTAAFTLDSQLRGFALHTGGSLTLAANTLCIAAANCGAADPTTLWVSPQLFSRYGFSRVSVGSDLGGLTVAAGTNIQAEQVNYTINGHSAAIPGGVPLRDFATVSLLPAAFRQPASVTLTTNISSASSLTAAQFASSPELAVGEGAVISVDPGGSVSLSSNSSMVVAGVLSAPAGSISLATTNALQIAEFPPSQGIWLLDGAQLLAPGAALVQTDDRGRVTGTVLNGGTISVTATRGYVLTDPHSVMDASGTTATLDITNTFGADTAAVIPKLVGSSGGTISLTAAEGLILNGSIRAAAGAAPGTGGGTLDVTVNGNLDLSVRNGEIGTAPFPTNPRQIVVADSTPIIFAPNTAIPDAWNGIGRVPAATLQGGGFGTVSLMAADLYDASSANPSHIEATGSIVFPQSVALKLPAALILGAQELSLGSGAVVSLSAPYVAIGTHDTRVGTQDPITPTPGSGTLSVAANLVDLIGSIGFSGSSTTHITSTGDIRGLGVEVVSAGGAPPQPLSGELQTLGELTLSAAQIYPTTLSQYSINVTGTGSRLDILPQGPTAATPLSAGGSLTLSADTINQAGVVRAPFGRVTLEGNTVTLGAGSLTSTSGAGETIPFGSTQAGADWVYPLPIGATDVYTKSGPPGKSIGLQGDDITVAKGATVSLAGGGDLQAYEFVPGVGGTVDVLSPSVNPQEFAILPTSGLRFAPYDPQALAGFGYPMGTTVVLGAGSGAPAGTYAVLPPRYALLPGAFLVTPVSGYTDLPSGRAISAPLGVIVAGQFGQVGVGAVQSRTSGFEVLPGADVPLLGQYSLTSASSFFSALAKTNGTVAPQLPADAGQLQLSAGSALQFLGTLASSPASGGRGGDVDLSANAIEITAGAAAATPGGPVIVPVSELNNLGAESLLIGGVRSSYSGAVAINTTASSVTVDSGAALTAPDLLLSAQNTLTVNAGASLTATGTNDAAVATQFDLTGGGAFLRVSTGAQARVIRTALDSSQGNLLIAPGASLKAPGSAVLEASGNLQSGAQYHLQGASLAFVAPEITLGAPGSIGPGVTGLTLNPGDLSQLGLSELSLTSASSIGIAGSSTLNVAGNLALQTGAIDAITPDAALTAHSSTLALSGTGTSAPAPALSSGDLTLEAATITLSGTTTVSGFAATSLSASREIRAVSAPLNSPGNGAPSGPNNGALNSANSGALDTDHQLTLATPLFDTDAGVTFALASGGPLALLPLTGGKAAATTPGAGGALLLTGAGIEIDTTIALPSGLLTATAQGSGNVDVGSSASLQLAGKSVTFDGLTVDAPGGRIDVNVPAGNFSLAPGAQIDVSGAGSSGAAGDFIVTAPSGSATLAGTLTGTSGGGATGGSFVLEAAQLPDLGALNGLLNSGGFSGSRSFTQTGAGDLVLASGSTIRANNITLSDDGGALDVRGTIDASGTNGGSVLLTAANGIQIEGAIDVHGTAAAGTPGVVQLDTTTGGVELAPGATINLGSSGGSLEIRVPRGSLIAADGTVAPQIALAGAIIGGSHLQVEGVATYTAPGGIISAQNTIADPSNPWYADAANFMQNAPGIAAALGAPPQLAVSVLPGVEVDSTSDLTLASDWNLAAWRFGGAPGVLTLRAAGNLSVQANLSDGFADTATFTLPTTPDQSWSYRLVAGASLGASNPLAVVDAATLSAGSGNLSIAPGTADSGATPPTPIMVRTGTGTIDIAAAGNLQFGNQASVIYTAGVNSNAGVALPNLDNLAYPTGGGNIDVTVGGDIVGAATNQLVTGWLWRTGQSASQRFPAPTGWTVNYQWFEENIGALGGGNVNIAAGGNIRELSVALPTIGVQVGGTTADVNNVQVTGGGQLGAVSGGNILGGSYYVGQGSGTLTAWGGIGADTSGQAGATGLAPIVALGNATLAATARSGLTIETVVNPTLLPQAASQATTLRTQSSFSTYSGQSAVTLLASAGDVALVNEPTSLLSQLTSMPNLSTASQALLLYPATLNAEALAGNVFMQGQQSALWPSPRGNLNLLASQGVTFGSGFAVFMSDVDPLTLPSPAAPTPNTIAIQPLFEVPASALGYTPIHSAAYAGTEDPNPARVVALTGDITNADLAFIAKPSHIVAGGTITDLYLHGENVAGTDETLVSAGGNITYPFPRDPNLGTLVTDNNGIVLEGPGSLLITAGGTINLGTSSGITTAGNLYNSGNAATGASVTALAGLNPAMANLTGFIHKYLTTSDAYDELLLSYVSARSPAPVSSKQAALAALADMSPEQQFGLCQQIMLAEIRLGGEAAAAPGPQHDDYTRSFTALTTLFPAATDTSATGAQTKYPGSISLYFSRIYTLDGGDVTLLAPGGGVDVGIASPPLAFGLTKQASDLGIVAQGPGNVSSVSYGSFNVNESRVFAADGGDILVWSTEGDIDAGRGAKTAISAPPPTITFNAQGQIETVFPAALQGSGIQALAVSAGVEPGNVDLFAPHGVVNAGDAGIVAGNLTIGATAVLGRDNITVSGISVGVPVEATGLGASVASTAAVANSTTSMAAAAVESASNTQSTTPLAESATSWLDVFVIGLGEENCRPDDVECLKRAQEHSGK